MFAVVNHHSWIISNRILLVFTFFQITPPGDVLTPFLAVVGCKFSDKIIYPETFVNNPDSYDAVYSTEYGIYKPHCGLDNVMLSWGHDEVCIIHVHPTSCHS